MMIESAISKNIVMALWEYNQLQQIVDIMFGFLFLEFKNYSIIYAYLESKALCNINKSFDNMNSNSE